MSAGYICGVPSSVMRAVKVIDEPERWCFGERKRRTGKHICRAPDMDWVMETEAYGWAEPVWRYECDGCGQDRRAFPGHYWEYGEP